MLIRDKVVDEIAALTLTSAKLDESYKASKVAIEGRIALLNKVLPLVTPEVEHLIQALGITL